MGRRNVTEENQMAQDDATPFKPKESSKDETAKPEVSNLTDSVRQALAERYDRPE